MSDIEKKIEAVEILMASFFGDPSEDERQASIRAEASENKYVKTYARFTEAMLQEKLRIFHEQSIC